MEPRIKAGLILILVGTVLTSLDIIIYIFFFTGPYFLPSFILIIVGLCICYSGLSMRGRGFLLNIIGALFSVFTVAIIVFSVISRDIQITLIIVFILFWFFVFNFSGLYKMITQDDVSLGCKILDLWAILTMFCIVTYTIIGAVIAKDHFSEFFINTFAIILTASIIICGVIAGIVYLYATDQLWIMFVAIATLITGTLIFFWFISLFFQFF